MLKISGHCHGTFRAPCPMRFLGRLGGQASGPISCCCNDMPSEHGRLEGTPRVPKSGTKWDFCSEIPASVHQCKPPREERREGLDPGAPGLGRRTDRRKCDIL